MILIFLSCGLMEVGNESKIVRYFIRDHYLDVIALWYSPVRSPAFKSIPFFLPGFLNPPDVLSAPYRVARSSALSPSIRHASIDHEMVAAWQCERKQGDSPHKPSPPDFTSTSDERIHPSGPPKRTSFRFPPASAHPAKDRHPKASISVLF